MDRIVRTRELLDLLQISRTTAWRWQRRGILPPRRRIGPNVTGWRASELEEFIESREPVNGDDSDEAELVLNDTN